MIANLPLFPETASTMARRVDALFFFLLGVSGFFALLIAVLVVVFAIRFRRGRSPEPAKIPGSWLLEAVWTLVPFGLAMVMFVWSARIYVDMFEPPEDALEVFVVGKQWMWKVQHLEGRREINELHVPVGRPVKLTMTSEDVIHSFYVPAFRLKNDVLPGRYTTLWFEATRTGTYHLFCAEYCGTEHSRMVGRVVVLEPDEFERWLEGEGATETVVARGEQLFRELGCASCHAEVSGARGPSLRGLFGSRVELADGRVVVADEAYVRESILDPQAKIVRGYEPVMPTFSGLVDEEGLLALVAYVRSLATAPGSSSAEGAPKLAE
ncbi:MAG: cytochrome c oxidase subunit 2 [Candidatus Binatia bacterium]|nr:MAG: cytochrome c oxidase subunit 2 [Candidatus Binatia bacterium]